MAQITGECAVTINGVLLDTFPGVVLDTGGKVRTQVESAKNTHFSTKRRGAKLDIETAMIKGSSIKDLDVEGATIQAAFDTGQTYVINNAFRIDPANLGDEGKNKTSFGGDAALEI